MKSGIASRFAFGFVHRYSRWLIDSHPDNVSVCGQPLPLSLILEEWGGGGLMMEKGRLRKALGQVN